MGSYKLSLGFPARDAPDSSDRGVAEDAHDSGRRAEELQEHVRQAAKGSEEAIGWLYERYHPRVYRYALAKLGDSYEAEDVSGDAFTAVVAKIPRRGATEPFGRGLQRARDRASRGNRGGWGEWSAGGPDRPLGQRRYR